MRLAAMRCIMGAWIVLVYGSVGPSGEVRPQIIWHRDFDIAISEAQILDRPVLAYVTTKWCPACLRHERTTFVDKRVVKFLGESVVAVQVNADSSPELAQRLGAEKYPTTVLLTKDGSVIGRIEGYRPAEGFLAEIAASIVPLQKTRSSVAKNSTLLGESTAVRGPRLGQSRKGEIDLAVHNNQSASRHTEVILTVDFSSNLILEGSCPVTFVQAKKLATGNPEFSIEYDGRTYWFASPDALSSFNRDPIRYAPAMGGLCVVSLVDDGVEIEGLKRFAAIYRGRFYLFASSEQRRRFQIHPIRYANHDLVADGHCVVCRTEHEQPVEGTADHQTMLGGLLYRFDTPGHRDMFLAAPHRYSESR
jgi:YHS domain-containing protein/thiol-disulfide isomerase/thioredoxin